MDYVIIVNDNGELKTISATEFDRACNGRGIGHIDDMLNAILDKRSAAEEREKIIKASEGVL